MSVIIHRRKNTEIAWVCVKKKYLLHRCEIQNMNILSFTISICTNKTSKIDYDAIMADTEWCTANGRLQFLILIKEITLLCYFIVDQGVFDHSIYNNLST